jgi:hypothetical protein
MAYKPHAHCMPRTELQSISSLIRHPIFVISAQDYGVLWRIVD